MAINALTWMFELCPLLNSYDVGWRLHQLIPPGLCTDRWRPPQAIAIRPGDDVTFLFPRARVRNVDAKTSGWCPALNLFMSAWRAPIDAPTGTLYQVHHQSHEEPRECSGVGQGEGHYHRSGVR